MVGIVLVLVSFMCGSLPFSVWLGRFLLKIDVRQYGDGNPGAVNVFRSGNQIIGLLALLLDISKSAVPVGLSYYNLNIRGITMFFIAIAPVLGHIFSPFLGFRGGKALSASLGVWIGLTIWKASLAGVIGCLIGIGLITSSGWSVMLGLLAILVTLLVWIPDPLLIMVWASETMLLAWTHRADLQQPPHPRSWLAKRLVIFKK